ncbi:MAG: hypothetical protein OES24_16580 [Acidimicrobiia bacterium]|nr:hypothetical protein [Acidimicrobiia bacterium]
MLRRTVVTTLATVPWAGPRVLLRLHDRGLGFDIVTWPEFAAAVARERPCEVSVDVYDTCLIRDLGGDRAIEEAIRHRSATTTDPASSIVDHAEALERELCRPVPGAREALAAIRSVVGSITFVSDTDRSSALLVDLLSAHGLFVGGDRLFASCEEGTTKSDGDLFTRIWPVADAGTVWHLGNNPWGDGTMAAGAGLRPFHLAEADLDRYEAIMARSAHGEGPAIAGAARRSRLDVVAARRSGELTAGRARARLVGAGVGGQALSAFNLWLSRQAREFDLTSLGYLARDGELPLRMARAMPGDHWAGVSLRYLHCSRVNWGLASASAVGVEAWLRAGRSDDGAFLLTHRHDVPISTLLARIGLTHEDLDTLGGVHRSIARRAVDSPLPAEADAEWQRLLDDDRVAEIIALRSEDRRSLVVDYLAGEQMFDGRIGLVDVGWRGRLAWHISSVVRSAGAADPVHLHFGGDKIIGDVDRTITIKRFAFQGDGPEETTPGKYTIPSPVVCVETLTASGKPRVVDYRRRSDGSIDLGFSDTATNGEFADDGDRADLWAGALAVASALPSRRRMIDWGLQPTDLGADVRALLGRWWNRPTNDEVSAIAHLRFEHDEAGSSYHPLAAPYSWEEVARAAGSRRAWVKGSEALTPWPIRLLVVGGRRVRDVLDRLRQ